MSQAKTVADVRYEQRYWYPHDGGAVRISGYQLIDRESGRYLGRAAAELAECGIAVHPAGGGEQVGWVPREVATEISPELDAGRSWSAVVLREQRRSPRDPRHGLTMLLARTAKVELRCSR